MNLTPKTAAARAALPAPARSGAAYRATLSRRAFITAGAAVGAGFLLSSVAEARSAIAAGQEEAPAFALSALTAHTFTSARHRTRYWASGPADGPLLIFVHGWPQSGLMWRAQMEAFAAEGWRCIAPDMRGYGGSSAPAPAEAYALREIV